MRGWDAERQRRHSHAERGNDQHRGACIAGKPAPTSIGVLLIGATGFVIVLRCRKFVFQM
ncbi:PEP-CTERM sorting domain-containing protein [Pseudomonas sp. 770NI]|nr:PEP-CTERM sorting domain-containing protein [Pseudomonas sp. AU8050]RZI21237.1 PEP-CTERM sorting domain-containing protein [Pseudomonas sp. 770NI]